MSRSRPTACAGIRRPTCPTDADFVDGMVTMLANRDPSDLEGVAVHLYRANKSMERRVFVDADGELLIIPQQGTLRIATEFGRMEVAPGTVAVGSARREVSGRGRRRIAAAMSRRTMGLPLRLPELGPIGSNGLANPRDFETPVAWFEDKDEPTEVIQKSLGSPVDDDARPFAARRRRVARQLRAVPLRLRELQHDRHDQLRPSRSVDLHRADVPSDVPGRANADFVIFPPRWMVAEDTFRPPWFHRNVMSEAMGLIYGAYDAKAEGFQPGGLSLAQFDERSRARPRKLAQGERGGAQAGEDRRHDGVHGRDLLALSPDAIRARSRAARL